MEGIGRPAAALGGVVVDDVDEDLEPRRVQRIDHRHELALCSAGRRIGGIGGLRGEERHRTVAPEVQQPLAGLGIPPEVLRLVELEERQELDRGDAERLQVRDLLDQAEIGSGMGDAGGRMAREAAQVELVDHPVAIGDLRPGRAPVAGRATLRQS